MKNPGIRKPCATGGWRLEEYSSDLVQYPNPAHTLFPSSFYRPVWNRILNEMDLWLDQVRPSWKYGLTEPDLWYLWGEKNTTFEKYVSFT